MNTKNITKTAISAALVFAATYFLRFPLPAFSGAYINLGDCVIFLSAYLLGGLPAAIAGLIGSVIADITAGAAIYAPATAVIKFLMGIVAGVIIGQGKAKLVLLASVAGGFIMTLGYGLYELAVFGFEYAAAALPMNLLQAGGAVIITMILYPAFGRLKRLA